MPIVSLRVLLDRFRPAPPPGQPGPLGVPSQTPHTAVEELASLFLIVDEIEAECAAVKADGEERATRTLDDAAARAARIEADAERDAKEARDAASRVVRGRARERVAAMLSEADRDADDIRRRESAELADRVESAVGLVRAIGDEPADRPADTGEWR